MLFIVILAATVLLGQAARQLHATRSKSKWSYEMIDYLDFWAKGMSRPGQGSNDKRRRKKDMTRQWYRNGTTLECHYERMAEVIAPVAKIRTMEDHAWWYWLAGKIFGLQYNRILQMFLSLPVVLYHIPGVLTLPFNAKATENVFGMSLALTLNPHSMVEITNQSIKEAMQSVIDNCSHRGDHIIRFFMRSFRKFNNPSQKTVVAIFEEILESVTSFLDLSYERSPFMWVDKSPFFTGNQKYTATVKPDFAVRDVLRNIVCVVKIIKPCLFRKQFRVSPSIDQLCYGAMKDIVIELQTQMIVTASRFGIISDGHHLILVEFADDLSYYQRNYLHVLPNGQTEMRLPSKKDFCPLLRVRILNVLSSSPSFLEGLCHFLYRAQQAKKETPYSPIFDYFHLAVKVSEKPLTHSPRVPSGIHGSAAVVKLFLNWCTKAEILERTDVSVSLKIQAKHLKRVLLDPVDDEEFVVMQIYDPVAVHDPTTPMNREEAYKLSADGHHREMQAITKLSGFQEFNNIYLNHKQVEIEFFEGFGCSLIGRALIRKFVEYNPVPRTLESYFIARQQLDIIHRAGIIYGGDYHQILMQASKLYLPNFSSSKLATSYNEAKTKRMMAREHQELCEVFLGPNAASTLALSWQIAKLVHEKL